MLRLSHGRLLSLFVTIGTARLTIIIVTFAKTDKFRTDCATYRRDGRIQNVRRPDTEIRRQGEGKGKKLG